MTILRHNLISGSIVDGDLPRIGYTNLFRSGTVTVSSEDVDHPKELAYDGFTYDAWRTTGGATEYIRTQVSSQNADYMAIGAHTLAGCNVTPQRSADGSSWTSLHTAYTVPDNRPIVWEWTSVAAAYWRLLIENAAGAVSVGAIHVGLKLTMQRGLPVGWKPPELNEDRVYTNSVSEGGNTLGRSVIRRGAKVEITGAHSEFVWTREDWLACVEAAERYAVFFWWANEGKASILYGQMESSEGSFSTEKLVSPRIKLAGTIR